MIRFVVILILLLFITLLAWSAIYFRNSVALGELETQGPANLRGDGSGEQTDVYNENRFLQQRFERIISTSPLADSSTEMEELHRMSRRDNVFPPVHRWFIQRLLSEDDYYDNPKKRAELRRHFVSLALVNDVTAEAALAQLAIADGNLSEGVRRLRVVARSNPGINLFLSKTLAAAGQESEAIEAAERATRHYQRRCRDAPEQGTLVLSLAESLAMEKRYEEAIDLLRPLLSSSSSVGAQHKQTIESDVAARSEAAIVDYTIALVSSRMGEMNESGLMVESDSAEAMDHAADFELIQAALGIQPDSLDLWSILFALRDRQLTAHDIHRLELDRWIIQMTKQDPHSSGLVRLVQSSHHFQRGNVTKAIKLLRDANDILPGQVEIMNNLACYLSHDQPPQTKQALEIADEMIEAFPGRLELRETRGQIRAIAGMVAPAIEDLEVARKALPNHQPLLETLEKLYRTSGETLSADLILSVIKRNERSSVNESNKSNTPSIKSLIEMMETSGA